MRGSVLEVVDLADDDPVAVDGLAPDEDGPSDEPGDEPVPDVALAVEGVALAQDDAAPDSTPWLRPLMLSLLLPRLCLG